MRCNRYLLGGRYAWNIQRYEQIAPSDLANNVLLSCPCDKIQSLFKLVLPILGGIVGIWVTPLPSPDAKLFVPLW